MADDLRQLRRDRGLSLEAVGFLAGADKATISRIERGLQKPKPELVVQLARALGVSAQRMDRLMKGGKS
jgi:transcriptional regulator with XRE-family HTH domain